MQPLAALTTALLLLASPSPAAVASSNVADSTVTIDSLLMGVATGAAERPPSNLVFLVDVSSSMWSPRKLPLLEKDPRMLAEQLRPEDRVTMVVCAGSLGLVLESTPGLASLHSWRTPVEFWPRRCRRAAVVPSDCALWRNARSVGAART